MRLRFNKTKRQRQEVGFRPNRVCSASEPGRRRLREDSVSSQKPAVAVVNLDLGEQNAVFIRGHGGGLRWDKGQPLSCVGPRHWAWSPGALDGKLEFQLLLNDEVWARGDKVVLEPGWSIEVTPDFEWPEIPKTS